jgi:hypothetical protein
VAAGERADDRDAMDRLTRDILDQPLKGGRRFSAEEAQQMARDTMREVDRRLREQGRR